MRITRTKIKTTIIEFTLLLILLQIWIVQCKKIDIEEVLSDSTTTITIYNSYQGSLVKAGENQEVSQDNEGAEPIGEEAPSPTDIETKIRQAFPECPDKAVAIARCESSLRPEMIGDTFMSKYSYGLFQINRTWHDYPEETLLNPDENIKIARQIFDRSGGNFGRWSCNKTVNN